MGSEPVACGARYSRDICHRRGFACFVLLLSLELHMALQGAFGWENCHLFEFSETGLGDKVCYGLPYDNDELDPGYVKINARDLDFPYCKGRKLGSSLLQYSGSK